MLLETTAVRSKTGRFPVFRQRIDVLGACHIFLFITLSCNRIISSCFMKFHTCSVGKKIMKQRNFLLSVGPQCLLV